MSRSEEKPPFGQCHGHGSRWHIRRGRVCLCSGDSGKSLNRSLLANPAHVCSRRSYWRTSLHAFARICQCEPAGGWLYIDQIGLQCRGNIKSKILMESSFQVSIYVQSEIQFQLLYNRKFAADDQLPELKDCYFIPCRPTERSALQKT